MSAVGARGRRPFRVDAATPAPGPVPGPGRDQQLPPAPVPGTGQDQPLRRIRAGLVETIALAVLPVAWLWATISVLGEAWVWPVVGALASMAIVAAIVRQVLPAFAGTVVAALVGFGWITALTAPEEALLGFVPTPEAFGLTMAALNEGVLDIAWTPSTPMDVAGPVLVVIVAAAVVLAVNVDLLGHALRVPAIAVVFAAAPIVLPIAFRIDVPWWHALPGAIASAALLAAPAIDERTSARRDWIGPVALVGIAAVLSAAVPLVAPSPRDAQLELPTLDQLLTPATPILNTDIDLGDELRRPDDRPVFTYSTTDGEPMLTRLMTLPEAGENGFVAVEPRPGSPEVLVEGADLGAALQMTVRMGPVRAESLPTPERVAGVRAPEGSSWDDANDALRISSDVDTSGLEYTASGSRSRPLDSLPPDSGSTGQGEFLALPEAAQGIGARGAALVDPGMSSVQRVDAVQSFMTGGLWNYSEQLDLPGFAGAGGDGWAALEGFFETRSGYCVQYASATATLLRGADVPSRIAVGFLPGSAIDGGWAVTTNEMHAWAEAWIDGAGWVRVETTPGAGTGTASPTGDAVTQSPTPEPSETAPEESEAPTDTPEPSASADAPEPTSSAAPGDHGEEDAGFTIDPVLLRALLIGLGVLLLLALPWGIRAVQRTLRLRRGAPGGWRELRATLADLGVLLPASATPGAVQAAIAQGVEPDAEAASDLVRLAAERAVFDAGSREPGAVDADVRAVRRALVAGAPPWRRVLASALPPSLLRVIPSED